MIKEEKVLQEVTIKHFYCDDCKKEVDTLTQCENCNRHLCKDCVIEKTDLHSDYFERYCKECWGVKAPFMEKITELNIKENTILDHMEDELKKVKEKYREQNLET